MDSRTLIAQAKHPATTPDQLVDLLVGPNVRAAQCAAAHPSLPLDEAIAKARRCAQDGNEAPAKALVRAGRLNDVVLAGLLTCLSSSARPVDATSELMRSILYHRNERQLSSALLGQITDWPLTQKVRAAVLDHEELSEEILQRLLEPRTLPDGTIEVPSIAVLKRIVSRQSALGPKRWAAAELVRRGRIRDACTSLHEAVRACSIGDCRHRQPPQAYCDAVQQLTQDAIFEVLTDTSREPFDVFYLAGAVLDLDHLVVLANRLIAAGQARVAYNLLAMTARELRGHGWSSKHSEHGYAAAHAAYIEQITQLHCGPALALLLTDFQPSPPWPDGAPSTMLPELDAVTVEVTLPGPIAGFCVGEGDIRYGSYAGPPRTISLTLGALVEAMNELTYEGLKWYEVTSLWEDCADELVAGASPQVVHWSTMPQASPKAAPVTVLQELLVATRESAEPAARPPVASTP